MHIWDCRRGTTPNFILINDPLKIARLARNRNYTNSVVQAVEKRFSVNANLMNYFFTNTLSDEERWQFIEDYFLGKSEEELTLSSQE